LIALALIKINSKRHVQIELKNQILQTRFFKQMPVLREEDKKNLGIGFLEMYGPKEEPQGAENAGVEVEFNDKPLEVVEVAGYVAVSNDMPLKDKLELLIGQLSEKQFEGKPMKLVNVAEKGGKKIAVIDIIDPKEPEDENSWYQSFQGSTGGLQTQGKLTKTLLQANYRGEWVDGIEFTYNGKPFDEYWDHINLSGMRLR
jgi:hypothetical protein